MGFPEPFLVFLAFFIKALWCGEYSTDWGFGFSRGGGKSGWGFDANLEKADNEDDPEVDPTDLRLDALYKPWKNVRCSRVLFRFVAPHGWGQV